MANPVLTWVNTYAAGAGPAGASGWMTFSFCMTQGFEARVPVQFLMTGRMSFSPEIHIVRSTDGGGTWETFAAKTVRGVFANDTPLDTGVRTLRKDIVVDPGMYLVLLMTGSSAQTTYSAALGTAELITAYA